jgi:hypothetical protein
MSQDRNTMSPSRRSMLAGISIAVAPAVAVADKSLGAIVPSDDPIFAVIAEHLEAVKADCLARPFPGRRADCLEFDGIAALREALPHWENAKALLKIDGGAQKPNSAN